MDDGAVSHMAQRWPGELCLLSSSRAEIKLGKGRKAFLRARVREQTKLQSEKEQAELHQEGIRMNPCRLGTPQCRLCTPHRMQSEQHRPSTLLLFLHRGALLWRGSGLGDGVIWKAPLSTLAATVHIHLPGNTLKHGTQAPQQSTGKHLVKFISCLKF